uniref:Uncharacterized protein n=1 Tax=Arundo donax TaxID=35708 RepID=A0A0A9HRS2_ARUDO
MSNIRPRDSEINKIAHNMPISRRILKRCTISRTKLQMKVHRCCCRSVIRNTRTSNKILYIFGLRNVISLSRIQNLNAQKIAEDPNQTS